MEPLHTVHLMTVCVWLGIVITEALFEFSASDADSLRAAARFHCTVDKYGELPILFLVVATGGMLAARAWPLTPLHLIKIAAALIAVASNLICSVWVFRRRTIVDRDMLLGFRRRIWSTAAVGVVSGTLSLLLGLAYFRG